MLNFSTLNVAPDAMFSVSAPRGTRSASDGGARLETAKNYRGHIKRDRASSAANDGATRNANRLGTEYVKVGDKIGYWPRRYQDALVASMLSDTTARTLP